MDKENDFEAKLAKQREELVKKTNLCNLTDLKLQNLTEKLASANVDLEVFKVVGEMVTRVESEDAVQRANSHHLLEMEIETMKSEINTQKVNDIVKNDTISGLTTELKTLRLQNQTYLQELNKLRLYQQDQKKLNREKNEVVNKATK